MDKLYKKGYKSKGSIDEEIPSLEGRIESITGSFWKSFGKVNGLGHARLRFTVQGRQESFRFDECPFRTGSIKERQL